MQKTKIEIDKQGRYEFFKLNRKGFYNFVKYLTQEEYEKEMKKNAKLGKC